MGGRGFGFSPFLLSFFFGNHLIREYKYIGMNSRDRAIYRFRVMTFFVAGFRSLILRDRNKWLGVL